MAKNSAKATVTMVNAKFGAKYGKPIQHLWAWGNNDVLPKRQPLQQAWLEDFGAQACLMSPQLDAPWGAPVASDADQPAFPPPYSLEAVAASAHCRNEVEPWPVPTSD